MTQLQLVKYHHCQLIKLSLNACRSPAGTGWRGSGRNARAVPSRRGGRYAFARATWPEMGSGWAGKPNYPARAPEVGYYTGSYGPVTDNAVMCLILPGRTTR